MKGADAGRAAPSSPGLAGVQSRVRDIPCSSEVLHAPGTKVSQGQVSHAPGEDPITVFVLFFNPIVRMCFVLKLFPFYTFR